MSINRADLCILVIVVLFNCAYCYKILLLPVNVNSHFQYFGKMGHGLGQMGHAVEMLVPSNGKIPWGLATSNFSIISYPVNGETSIFDTKETSDVYLRYALAENKFIEHFKISRWWFNKSTIALNDDCENMLKNHELMDKLLNQTKIDFIITDFVLTQCQSVLINFFKVPYAILSIPICPWNAGIPRFPSFVPNYSLAFGDKMNFFERFASLLAELVLMVIFIRPLTPSHIPEYLQKQSMPHDSMIHSIRSASLYLYLEDLTVGYPNPWTPDVISVGDISAGSPLQNLLPHHIDEFLQDKSAVYMSFGSFFNFPSEKLMKKFCQTFHSLKDLRIIWKLNNNRPCAPEVQNVLALPWVPQNDLLADSRIKLFITHGGFNSLMESIYHAKQIIVFPLAADQPAHAKMANDKGYAKQMDLRYWSPDDLASTIREMLRNSSYQTKAKHYSDLLKSRHDTPAERVSVAISNVIRFGTEHLRSSAKDLYWFQFMMFDLFLTLWTIVLVVGFLITYLPYRLFKFLIQKYLHAGHEKIKVT